jgi:molecular chaperone HscB
VEAMVNIDFNRDYFSLFGMPPQYVLDLAQLERAYRDLQAQVHPDRHAHLGEVDKRLALQWATQVNQAYRTLLKPIPRASYLLSLRGVDLELERNTAMSPEFLMAQMEWREGIAEAKAASDVAALEDLYTRLCHENTQMAHGLAQELDQHNNNAAAAEWVRRMMFIDKLQHEIQDALEALDT